MKAYFGFGLSDNMFPEHCAIYRNDVDANFVVQFFKEKEVISCINPSHKATINVMKEKLGVDIHIPEKAPIVKLHHGDTLIIMGISGLPRLEGRHEYSQEEIDRATFKFSRYIIEEEHA
jgi:hypothetical protein